MKIELYITSNSLGVSVKSVSRKECGGIERKCDVTELNCSITEKEKVRRLCDAVLNKVFNHFYCTTSVEDAEITLLKALKEKYPNV